MSDIMKKVTFLLRRGLKKDLPNLLEGEMGLATDTKELYVGTSDGRVQMAKQDDVDQGLNGLDDKIGILSKERTTIELLSSNSYEVDKFISTQGFYSVNDKGGALWLVKNTEGNEVWSSTGYGFDISAKCEIKYQTNKKLVFVGDKVKTKQLGCKADGTSNDSVIVRNVFQHTFNEIFVSEGVHIINITPGTTHAMRSFTKEITVPSVLGTKGKSIIRLGSGNLDETKYTGFEALFKWKSQADLDVYIDGITLDYNLAQNPPYHYQAQYSGVEYNSQNFGIYTNDIRNLTVTNCTFIDHNGTNLLLYRPNLANTKDPIVTVANNKFEDIGKPSNYIDPATQTVKQAFHDCSTVSIHSRDAVGYNRKVYAYVYDNIFKGIGGNAHNTCEVGVDVHYFYNNYVEGYNIGNLLLTAKKDVIVKNYNNVYRDVMKGTAIWAYKNESINPEELGFKLVEIKDNKYYINPTYHKNRATWNEYTLASSGFYDHLYLGITFGGEVYRDVDTFEVDGNLFEYTKDADLTVITGGRISGAGIGFNPLPSATVSTVQRVPFLKNFFVTNNTFINCYKSGVDYSTYPNTTNIVFKGNNAYNCMHDTGVTSKRFFSIEIIGNQTGFPYVSNALLHAMNSTVLCENNRLLNTDINYILALSFWETTYSDPNGLLIFKNNISNLAPKTAPYLLQGKASSIPTKITDVT